MSGWTTNLLTGLAEHLDAAAIGTWRPTGTYTAGETAIVIRGIPPAPDRLITLAPYPVGSPAGRSTITHGIQIRMRASADPRDVDDLADAVFDLLDSAGPLRFGGVVVNQLYRQSYTSLGQDSTGRWERSENYYVDAERPTAHRPT